MSKHQIRSSQVITTFGPGAMVDFPDSSVIVAGLDSWRYDLDNIPVVEEPRLVEKLCQVLQRPSVRLRMPPPAKDRPGGPGSDITAYRFPGWFLVQRTFRAGRTRRRRLVPLEQLDKGRFRDDDNKRYPVVPVRFVRACPRGHIGDIDWKAFVHGQPSDCPRELWMEERGTSGDLDQVYLVCGCGASRVMSQAARLKLEALGRCNGSRPWLGAGTREACGQPNRLLIRSASNAYFSQTLSVISIPDPRGPVDDLVRGLWDDGLCMVEGPDTLPVARKIPNLALKLAEIDDDTLLAAIERVRGGTDGSGRTVKEVEFEALSRSAEEVGTNQPDGDFNARTLPRDDWDAPWMAGIERVVLVHRLREVVAQVGFTRIESVSTDIDGELDVGAQRAAITTDQDWLPAVENRGEGIFLQFDAGALQQWMDRPEVADRGRTLLRGFADWKEEHPSSSWDFPGTTYYLLHSFSHLLMTAVSLECGYPASSIRERIYHDAAEGAYGILIYTGSSDAEGTLGGLVLAGRDIRRHVKRALDAALICSNDPVCSAQDPNAEGAQPLLGSACHGCLLVSETSCEQRNDLLDRALVVPTLDRLGAEFFHPDAT